jgi:hypothetical protein
MEVGNEITAKVAVVATIGDGGVRSWLIFNRDIQDLQDRTIIIYLCGCSRHR